MASLPSNAKIGLFVLIALIGGAAGFGYFTQAAKLSDAPPPPAKETMAVDQAVLAQKPNDIVLGDNNAIVSIVEYSSLSCPHCAHFHTKILPAIEKEFITTGKAKLIMRYFPLNDAAVKASEIVECAAQNGLKRENFVKVFFDMQTQWAFSDSFTKDLKQIAQVGGLDSAAFESCSNDKALEDRILAMRIEAAEKLQVNSTPSFFVNGIRYEGEPSVDGFRAAINNAGMGKK